MIVAFLGAWSGYAILGIIRIHGYADFSDYLIGVAMMLAKCGAWTNTIIFIWMNQEVLVLELPKKKVSYFQLFVIETSLADSKKALANFAFFFFIASYSKITFLASCIIIDVFQSWCVKY